MNPKNADSLNDLMHDTINPLVVLLAQVKLLQNITEIVTRETSRMERAVIKYGEASRTCPYATKEGAKCAHVPGIKEEGAKCDHVV